MKTVEQSVFLVIGGTLLHCHPLTPTVSRLAQQGGAGPITWGRWNDTISLSLSLSPYLSISQYLCINASFAALRNEINKPQSKFHCSSYFHGDEWSIKTGVGYLLKSEKSWHQDTCDKVPVTFHSATSDASSDGSTFSLLCHLFWSCNVYGCLTFVSLKLLAWTWGGQESIREHGHTMRLTWKHPCSPYEAADGTVPFHSWSLKMIFCNPLVHLLELSTLCTDVLCGMWAASLVSAVRAVCSRASTVNWLQINLDVGTEWMNSCMVNYAEWYRKM